MVRNQQAARAGGPEEVADARARRGSNPSAWSRRIIIVALAAIDFVLAAYMALYQWRIIDAVWDPVFGSQQTHAVLDSAVSVALRRIFLIPDAALGAVGYLAEVILGLVGSRNRWKERPWLVVAFGANAAALAAIGIILVLLQGVVVEAWCLVCLITAALSVLMLIIAIPEVRASVRHLRRRAHRGDNATPR